MDKKRDFEIYQGLHRQMRSRTDLEHKNNVIQTRILKLSSAQSQNFYWIIGSTLINSGLFEKSLVPLKRAIIINPQNSKAHVDLISALLKLNKENEAFSSMKKALSLSPTAYNLQSFLVKTLEEQQKLHEIDSFCQEIANMIKDTESIPLFYYGIAESLVRCNHHLQALGCYKKAIEMKTKKDSHYHYQYAMALYHEGLFEEAIEQFEHVKRLDLGNKRACNNIAFMYYCLGRVEKALEKYEVLIKDGLVECATYSNVILVLHHLDKDEEVINMYKDLFLPFIQGNHSLLNMIYNEELRQAQLKLQSDIDEETRGFYEKKLKGINLVLSFLN